MIKRISLRIFSIIVLSLTISGCLTWFQPVQEALQEINQTVISTPVVDEQLIQQGIEVYLSSYCGVCHMLEQAGTRGSFGTPHDQMGILATERLADPLYSGAAQTIEAYIRESILQPQLFIAADYRASAHQMPPFIHLSDADVDALVYLLSHQR